MDSFINLAKQGYEAYSESHSNVSRTGGSEYNSPDNQPQGQHRPSFNEDEVVETASQQGSGHSSMFSHAMNYVKNNSSEHEEPIDEEHVTNSHKEAYERGNAGSLDAGAMGSAAALQIFKQFASGGSGGGSSQSQLISMAMAEASNLFESSGGASSGSKQDAVNGAGMMVMKMLVQSKMSSMMGGGNSGGLGGLMGLASKFL
ncbi:hypothetical protein GYMLUDRAFT_723090 [Collybiopsis luxurians FD-317 M1]|nr:hypothetical protein GYMLUDRAFT_723090 [Collybiopsis luxurians FD-317 M1]